MLYMAAVFNFFFPLVTLIILQKLQFSVKLSSYFHAPDIREGRLSKK